MTPANPDICLISGNHLCNNPRVLKEADALHAAGYRVHVLGASLDATLAARDRALMRTREWTLSPVIDLPGTHAGARLDRARLRARFRAGRTFGSLAPLNPWQLGYCAPELLQAARRTDAALFIAHSEQALWAVDALHAEGRCVGIDFEDWYSEGGGAEGDRPQVLLRKVERELLCAGVHATCPSHAMSRAVAGAYGCRPPTVVYNTFEWQSRREMDGLVKDRHDRALPSLHWYSQTIGPDRGLDDLFRALPLLTQAVEIHLRGALSPAVRTWLASVVPAAWKQRVFIHRPVGNEELLSRIAEHDIGFAGETRHCRSRDVTVTNKMMHYLLAGLAVVASDTEGQMELAAQAPHAVSIYPSGAPQALADTIDGLLASRARLIAAREAALAAAECRFSWEHDMPKLIGAIEDALERRAAKAIDA